MTDIPENQVIDFEISKAHLEATGWSLNQFERSNPFDCHAVYVYDFRFQTPELFTFPINDFNDRIVEQPAQVLATVLEQWMKKRHRKKLKGRERRALPGVIADYVKASQSYRAWLTRKSANDRMHAFINIYGDKGVPTLVRPFMSVDSRPVIPVEEVISHAESAREMDLENHPEWFMP